MMGVTRIDDAAYTVNYAHFFVDEWVERYFQLLETPGCFYLHTVKSLI